MKKLVLVSLIVVGSSYAMDPEKETDKRLHTKTKNNENEALTPRKTPEPTIIHTKFCMENPSVHLQQCSCIAAVKREQYRRGLSRSRD